MLIKVNRYDTTYYYPTETRYMIYNIKKRKLIKSSEETKSKNKIDIYA